MYNWASGSEPTLVLRTEPPSYIYVYIYPSDLLASEWPRATRKRKASRLAHAHTAAKCNSTGSVYSKLKLNSAARRAKAA